MAADIQVTDSQVIITDSNENQALLIADDASTLFYGKSIGLSYLKVGHDSAALNFGFSSNISLAQTGVSLHHTNLEAGYGNSDMLLDKNGIKLSQQPASLSVAEAGISITDGSSQLTLNAKGITLNGNVLLSGYTIPFDPKVIASIFTRSESSETATQNNPPAPPPVPNDFSERDLRRKIGVVGNTPPIAVPGNPPIGIYHTPPPVMEHIPIQLPQNGGVVDLFLFIYKMATEINHLSERVTALERK